MSPLFDTHCHISHVEGGTRDILDQAKTDGVEAIVDIGMGVAESTAAADRTLAHTDIYASVGVHPNDLDEFAANPDQTMAALAALTQRVGVVAVGETGIDTYRDRSSVDLQEQAFRAHIDLAKGADLTLVVHCRDAHDRVLAVLDDAGAPSSVIMHCFSGDADFGRACVERSFYCSFAGNLTYKRNDGLRAVASEIPTDLLLVETDAPYLAPHPYRGKPNHPSLVKHTAAVLAEIRGWSPAEVESVLWANAHTAFGL